ncbi:MAG: hypothetical protein Q9195_003340 [Heterodermia aff. obscurata]
MGTKEAMDMLWPEWELNLGLVEMLEVEDTMEGAANATLGLEMPTRDVVGEGDMVAEVNILHPTGALAAVVEEAGEEVEEGQLPLLWVLYSPSPTEEITGHGLRVLWGLGRLRVEEEEEEEARIEEARIEVARIEVARRAGHLLEGPVLEVAETHRTRDSTTTQMMMTEEVIAVVVIDVVPLGVGRVLDQPLSAVRVQAIAGALGQPPGGTATVAIPAATADAKRQVRNQIRRIRAREKTHQAQKTIAATRMRTLGHQPAGHDRLRGTAYVVDVRVPTAAPLLWAHPPLRLTQP